MKQQQKSLLTEKENDFVLSSAVLTLTVKKTKSKVHNELNSFKFVLLLHKVSPESTLLKQTLLEWKTHTTLIPQGGKPDFFSTLIEKLCASTQQFITAQRMIQRWCLYRYAASATLNICACKCYSSLAFSILSTVKHWRMFAMHQIVLVFWTLL